MSALISVVIPLFNKAGTIGATIESVLSQGIDEMEIIVVDDGSEDNGADIVRKYSDGRIHLYRKENGGVSSARNYGFNKATGEWVMFLDADDTLTEGALIYLIKKSRFSESDIIAGNSYVQRYGVKKLYCIPIKEGPKRNPYISYLLKTYCLRPGNCIIRRKTAAKYSFNQAYTRNEDLEYSLNILEENTVYWVNYPVMVYNKDESFFSLPSKDMNNDYLAHLDIKGKPFQYRLVIHNLYRRGIRLYGESFKMLYDSNEYDKVVYKVFMYLCKVIKKTGLIQIIMSPPKK